VNDKPEFSICENCEKIDYAPDEPPYCHELKRYLEIDKDGKPMKGCGE
jgi:hypothetical protein